MLTQPQLETRNWVNTRNTALSSLSHADAALLAPHLQLVELPRDHRLERKGRPCEYVYFIDRGAACVFSEDLGGQGVEVGMVGREGIVGVAALLGAKQHAYDTQMLAPGAARRAPISAVREAMDDSPSLRRVLNGYVRRFLLQTMRTAQVNARATLEMRLARWLLMMHDRVDGDEHHMTHERLASVLGVRRAGVSVAAKKLERADIVLLHRGSIVIRDRAQLEESSGGTYGASDRLARAAAM